MNRKHRKLAAAAGMLKELKGDRREQTRMREKELILVAQVKFTEWTSDDQLRQPVFLGLQTDKAAKDVVRESMQRPTADKLIKI
jgi:ATP-dependent DNA ligase